MKSFIFVCCWAIVLFSAGCLSSGDVTVEKVSAEERLEYSSSMIKAHEGLMPESRNVLGNFLLNDLYRDEPERLLEKLERLFRSEPRDRYIETLADCAFNLGLQFRSDPDKASRYYLSAVLYAYAYLSRLDKTSSPYNPSRLGMLRIYNLALTELLAYLSDKKLMHSGGYELSAAAGQTVHFTLPDYRMAIQREKIEKVLLCADYRPVNLTHVTHRSGIGVPLIMTHRRGRGEQGEVFARDMVFPATAVMDFPGFPRVSDGRRRFSARLIYADSRNMDKISLDNREIPLERDLSTPLAYMAKDPPPFHFLFYMLRPGETGAMQGLYRFEPFDPKRIPVVLVHGLMSDTRTWLQMINTLRSDPVILKNYQIYGFSYSSGNPIVNSAAFLRTELKKERARIINAGFSPEKFDQMVLVGHSMGGLLSRLAISRSGDTIEKIVTANGKYKLDEMLEDVSETEKNFIRDAIYFEPLPFVKRTVFIAVPHRGSWMAGTWIGRFGAWCIRLPRKVIEFRRSKAFRVFLSMTGKEKLDNTGIDNLDPDNVAIRYLNMLEISQTIPYHSIIGNRNEAGCPGGSDGIVPYTSSHLDHAESELIVKSGHSAQKNPLAIQELRRILMLHLRSPEKKNGDEK